jgi:hypothetical protein
MGQRVDGVTRDVTGQLLACPVIAERRKKNRGSDRRDRVEDP